MRRNIMWKKNIWTNIQCKRAQTINMHTGEDEQCIWRQWQTWKQTDQWPMRKIYETEEKGKEMIMMTEDTKQEKHDQQTVMKITMKIWNGQWKNMKRQWGK